MFKSPLLWFTLAWLALLTFTSLMLDEKIFNAMLGYLVFLVVLFTCLLFWPWVSKEKCAAISVRLKAEIWFIIGFPAVLVIGYFAQDWEIYRYMVWFYLAVGAVCLLVIFEPEIKRLFRKKPSA